VIVRVVTLPRLRTLQTQNIPFAVLAKHDYVEQRRQEGCQVINVLDVPSSTNDLGTDDRKLEQ
jgi:hypothetical protein